MVTISPLPQPLPEKKNGEGSKRQERFGPRTRAKTLLSLQVPRRGGVIAELLFRAQVPGWGENEHDLPRMNSPIDIF
jgi:hypothetical protein